MLQNMNHEQLNNKANLTSCSLLASLLGNSLALFIRNTAAYHHIYGLILLDCSSCKGFVPNWYFRRLQCPALHTVVCADTVFQQILSPRDKNGSNIQFAWQPTTMRIRPNASSFLYYYYYYYYYYSLNGVKSFLRNQQVLS
jgi:hypothetical protein